MARQFQDGRYGKAVPVEADGPARLGKIIGGAEMDGQRQGGIARGGGMQFDLLADEVEAATDFERPALAVAGHHVPAVHVADIEAPGDPHVVEGAGQMEARAQDAVNAGILAAHQGGDFAERGAVHLRVEIDATRGGVPSALQGERSKALGGTVGAGGLGRTGDLPIAAGAGGETSRSVSVR